GGRQPVRPGLYTRVPGRARPGRGVRAATTILRVVGDVRLRQRLVRQHLVGGRVDQVNVGTVATFFKGGERERERRRQAAQIHILIPMDAKGDADRPSWRVGTLPTMTSMTVSTRCVSSASFAT